jgi:hypothetical protein
MWYSKDVHCGVPECEKHAEYKIAAPWAVGRFSELKSYGLCCAEHYSQMFQDAVRRLKIHPPSSEETQGEIGIYGFTKGKNDRHLERMSDLEQGLR